MDNVGKYEVITHPKSRISTQDVCALGQKRHLIQAQIEIDVTEARKLIREHAKNGEEISFTAWLIKCISCICEEYKDIHGIKKGKNKIVVFDDVDISIIVEREVQGKQVPLPYVLRHTNNKSISDIYREIRQAQKQPIENEGDFVLGSGQKAYLMKAYYILPGFFRRFLMKRMMKSPMLAKKNMGTVIVTSLGMAGRFNGWFTPISIHPLTFAVGSIAKKPGYVHNTVEAREYLYVTALVDHDIIDGAPAARSLAKLIDLMEKGHGL